VGTMARSIWIAVVAVLCVGTANATPYTIYGGGTESCGQWIASANNGTRGWLLSWVLGWVTAAGHYGVGAMYAKSPALQDSDADAIAAWLDNYCSTHSLDKMPKAVDALVQELAHRESGRR
jgi:hypothetical protein